MLTAIGTLSHLILIIILLGDCYPHFTDEYTGTFLISGRPASPRTFLVLESLLPNKAALSILKELWLKTISQVAFMKTPVIHLSSLMEISPIFLLIHTSSDFF